MRSTWTVWQKPAVSRSPTICPGRIPWSLVQPLSTLVEVRWFTHYPSFAEKLGVWDEGLYPCKAGSKMLKSFLKSSASPIPGISSCSLGTHLLTSPVNILSFPMKFIGYSLFIPHGIYFAFSKSLQRREVPILLPILNHLSQSPLKAEQDSVGPSGALKPSVSLISCSQEKCCQTPRPSLRSKWQIHPLDWLLIRRVSEDRQQCRMGLILFLLGGCE